MKRRAGALTCADADVFVADENAILVRAGTAPTEVAPKKGTENLETFLFDPAQ